MTLSAEVKALATDQMDANPLAPAARLAQLLDPGTSTPLHEKDDTGVLAVGGQVDGSDVMAYCTDATRMGGALGAGGCRHIVSAIDAAVRLHRPVIGLWHSGGARISEGVEALDGVGQVFAAMIRASGRVPQISVVLGPAAGGAAYGPALTDIVIMSSAGRIFVTGPEVVRAVTGEHIDMEQLGGVDVHGRKSGLVHSTVETEADAYLRARRITGLLARPGVFEVPTADPTSDPDQLLPTVRHRAYDVRPLVRALVDRGEFVELQPKWAPNMVVGFGRLGGRTIGVLANNPMRKGGCLDSRSAEKSARFVRTCDALGVPLVVVVDVPGYLPGIDQEWDGVVRRGAKLLHAFGESVVPRVTLITRKSFGGAYIAMNSRSLGATRVLAWPDAEVAVMGAEAAVGVIHRRRLAAARDGEREALRAVLVDEHKRLSGGVERGVALGVIDEVVQPRATRRRLIAALAGAPATRGRHGNIPL